MVAAKRGAIHLQMMNGRWWVVYPNGSGAATGYGVVAAKQWAYARNSALANNEYNSAYCKPASPLSGSRTMSESRINRLVHEPRKQVSLE